MGNDDSEDVQPSLQTQTNRFGRFSGAARRPEKFLRFFVLDFIVMAVLEQIETFL